MCPGAAWLLVSCFFLSVDSHTGKISPPQTPSLKWITEFEPELSWEPPEDLMTGCTYEVTVPGTKSPTENRTTWSSWVVMNGGFLSFAVRTKCNNQRSEPAVYNNSFPELVKGCSCYIYAPDRSYCSWEPAPNASHVRFYYQLEGQRNPSISPLRECQSYKYHDDGTRGCEIEGGHWVYVLFNDTRNDSRVWNTYESRLLNNVRPPALNWTVHKTKDKKFIIAWSPPDVGFELEWKYLIHYTQCDETNQREVSETSFQLERLPHCPYRMKIKAKSSNGESPWSEEKRFDAELNPNMAVLAAVIIPLLFACLAMLAFVCCRKNKENMFPKIPQPRDLLSDIADNNNKSNVCNMYVPAMEEENCKITLVSDPQVNNPSCDTVASAFI